MEKVCCKECKRYLEGNYDVYCRYGLNIFHIPASITRNKLNLESDCKFYEERNSEIIL